MMAFPIFDGMTQQLLSIVLSYTAPHIGGELETYVDRFVSNTSELTTLGVVWLAVTAVMLLSTIETAFNAIWRIEKPRPLGMRLIAYWTTLTLGPLLLGAGLSVSTAFAMNNFMPLGLDFGVIRNMALRMLPFLFAVSGFAILYLTLPNRRVGVRHALFGALVAGVLFEVLKVAFGVYVQNAGTFESVYGSLAALPVFLIWMYLVWAVVLFGAIFAATRPEWLAARRAEDFGPLTPARTLLRALQTWDRFWRGCRVRDIWRARTKTSRYWSAIWTGSPWRICTSHSAMDRVRPIWIAMRIRAGPSRWPG
jgi:membrane protein